MKKLLSLILLLCSVNVFAQNYSILGINISMPASPDANTANWGQGASPFTISARTTLDSNRQVAPNVFESRVLVTIKKAGSKLCGTYTNTSAPVSSFNTAVKVWNGRNAVSLLGQDCVLQPGDYELCVQFFGSYNGTEKPFSEEKCKLFTIKGTAATSDITYQPPQNVLPADKTVLKEADAKKPLNFRWTPVVPKPRENITYRLKVWQLMQGQNSTEAMRSNQPIVTKDVDNLTQATVTNMITERCRDPYTCAWVWTVEALGKEQVQGKQKNYGVSESTSFSISTANCVMSPTLVEATCISTTATSRTIRVKIKIENISSGANPATVYMNHANTLTHPLLSGLSLNASNLIQGKDQNFVVLPGVNTVIPANPSIYPTTITTGNFVIQEVDININNSITSFKILVITTSKGNNPGDALVPCYQDVFIDNIPPCPCTYCTDNMIVFNGQNQITDANNILTLNNNISIPGIQVKQFKAELIGINYAPQNGNEQCWVCNKNHNQWGNFTNGTFSSPFPSMVNGVFPSLPCCGGNSHHTIGWWGTATTINNRPLQLKISLPPASTLSCCPYNINVCIRYTFIDAECRSCSVVRCFSYIRQPATGPGPGPHLDLNEAVEIVPQNQIRN